jgi:serine/threonine protein kinase
VSLGGRMTFAPGDRIGDYEVLAPIGAGGMGSVYKARHSISQRIEALKVILPNASATPVIEERFLREIRLLASLEHPHIASLHSAFHFHDQIVMAMEFVEGVSLRDKLHSPGITLGQSLEYGSQVLAALAYAHAHGVIHRDIKPSNVMIGGHGNVKLLDFGLATSGHDSELTQPGTLVGSPFYISPEQARGEKADARSDVYSTGAMLYEMVAGRPPFESGKPGGAYMIISAHLHDKPRSPKDVNPEVPAELARVILKALAKKPKDRFESADEFFKALEGVRLKDTATVTVQSTHTKVSASAETRGMLCSDAELDHISKELATFVGPIAHILVRRAASTNHTLNDLCHSLAEEISSASNRELFLGKVGRTSITRSTAGTPSGDSQTSG